MDNVCYIYWPLFSYKSSVVPNSKHVQKAMAFLIQPLEDEGRYQKVCIEMYRTLFTHHCDFDILSE